MRQRHAAPGSDCARVSNGDVLSIWNSGSRGASRPSAKARQRRVIFLTSFGVLISIFGNVYPLLWSIAREGRWLRVWWKQDLNSFSKGFFFFFSFHSCFGSFLWSLFSSLLLLDLVPNLICARGKRISAGACLDAGKCIIAALVSDLGFFVSFSGIASTCVRGCWWRQACGSAVSRNWPSKAFCSRERELSGLGSKAKCFSRPRYKDNLSSHSVMLFLFLDNAVRQWSSVELNGYICMWSASKI